MANAHHAHLACVLKVEPRCHACKMHAMEVLSSLDGVYDVTLDSDTKTLKIMGEVDPNYCLKALTRCGIHAELIQAKLTHPRLVNRGYGGFGSNYDSYNNPSNYYPRLGRGMCDHDPYGSYNNHNCYGGPYRRSLPEGMWHDYPVRNVMPEYSYNTNYQYGGPATYSPYAPMATGYNPYGDHGCNIM